MKQRVQMDKTILAFVIGVSASLFFFPKIYCSSVLWDDVMDFIGVLCIIKGVMFRMVARGHKKANSPTGCGLVNTGIYRYVRNPMYLGTFLIGVGFTMIVWPWWGVVLFAGLFYWRFNRQIRSEEKHLLERFGKDYAQYCQDVPRLFPSPINFDRIKTSEVFRPQEALSTKEVYSLFWLLPAFALGVLQEKMVFGSWETGRLAGVFLSAIAVFGAMFFLIYQFSKRR